MSVYRSASSIRGCVVALTGAFAGLFAAAPASANPERNTEFEAKYSVAVELFANGRTLSDTSMDMHLGNEVFFTSEHGIPYELTVRVVASDKLKGVDDVTVTATLTMLNDDGWTAVAAPSFTMAADDRSEVLVEFDAHGLASRPAHGTLRLTAAPIATSNR